jgi:glycosyltransferase involved in cell wall biosynthesis
MASFGGLAALLFKKKFKTTPYILTLQEGDSARHIFSRAVWLGPYWRQMFKQADFITAISRYLKKFAERNGAKSEIEIVPNGVDLEKFKVQSEKLVPSEAEGLKVEEIRKKTGIIQGDKIIITVSRLVKKNGIEDVIEAMKYLPENYKFLILGEGPLEKKLKNQSERLKVKERVIFLGNVSNSQVPQYLASADVFVRPSLSEGLGNSFLEAMAAGVPVIGTKVGGIPDFLVDPSTHSTAAQGSGQATGLFCEKKNPRNIAEKIKLILTDSSLCFKIKTNAQKIVEEKYNWDLIAEKMKGVFNNF